MPVDRPGINHPATLPATAIPGDTPTADAGLKLVGDSLRNNFTGDSVADLARAGLAREGSYSGRVVVALMGSENFDRVRSAIPASREQKGIATFLQVAAAPEAVAADYALRSGAGGRTVSMIVPGRPGAALSAKSLHDVHDALQPGSISGEKALRQNAQATIPEETSVRRVRDKSCKTDLSGGAGSPDASRDVHRRSAGSIADSVPDLSGYDLETSDINPPGPADTTARNTDVYWRGLTSSANAALAGELVNRFNENPESGLKFLSRNVNPHRIRGMIKNLFRILRSPLRSRKVLKQNCISCAKAVDANLAQLASAPGRSGAVRFYQTKTGTEGALDQVNRSALDQTFTLDGKTGGAAETLRKKLPQGKAAIITVPFNNRGFSHAMNLVHGSAGSLLVIDGQNGKTYDLDNVQDCRRFERKYWNASRSDFPAIVSVYVTGDAPLIH